MRRRTEDKLPKRAIKSTVTVVGDLKEKRLKFFVTLFIFIIINGLQLTVFRPVSDRLALAGYNFIQSNVRLAPEHAVIVDLYGIPTEENITNRAYLQRVLERIAVNRPRAILLNIDISRNERSGDERSFRSAVGSLGVPVVFGYWLPERLTASDVVNRSPYPNDPRFGTLNLLPNSLTPLVWSIQTESRRAESAVKRVLEVSNSMPPGFPYDTILSNQLDCKQTGGAVLCGVYTNFRYLDPLLGERIHFKRLLDPSRGFVEPALEGKIVIVGFATPRVQGDMTFAVPAGSGWYGEYQSTYFTAASVETIARGGIHSLNTAGSLLLEGAVSVLVPAVVLLLPSSHWLSRLTEAQVRLAGKMLLLLVIIFGAFFAIRFRVLWLGVITLTSFAVLEDFMSTVVDVILERTEMKDG